MVRYLFKHLSEVLIFSGLLMLLIAVALPTYDRLRMRIYMARSYQNMSSLVEALQIYSNDHPNWPIFPPDATQKLTKIVLCPLRPTEPSSLAFLTTPVPILDRVPIDPFMTAAVRSSRNQTPVVLHWIKFLSSASQNPNGYIHLAWGTMNFGPSLQLPPQYDVTVFRNVPYETASLRNNFYDPSNGLFSLGILYRDSLGNRMNLK